MEPFIITAVVVGVIFLVIAAVILSRHLEKKRMQAMEAAAQELGFEFQGLSEGSLSLLTSGFELMNRGRGRKYRNVMHRQAESTSVYIADYQYTVSNGKNSTTHHQTIAVIQSPDLQLPSFNLYPENIFLRFAQALGMQDIDFEEAPKFSRMFVLRGDDEAAIREYFFPQALEDITELGAVSVAGAGDRMMIWFGNRRVKPQDLRTFFETAFKIHVLMSA